MNKSQFYGKTSLPSQQDQDVRNKAEEQMRLALEKVAQEKPDKTWSDPQERAKEVEEALFNLYGEPAFLPHTMHGVGWDCIVTLGGCAQA